MEDLDAVITNIGFGRWQIPALLCSGTAQLLWALQAVATTLLNAPVDFRCQPFNESLKEPMPNARFSVHNCTVPVYEYGTQKYVMEKDNFTNACPRIEYDTSVFESTVTTEWNLVCERAYLRPFFQLFCFTGSMFGSIACGILGDKFGRRPVIRIGCVGLVASIFLVAFSTSFTAVLIGRLFVGMSGYMLFLSTYYLALEFTPLLKRSFVGILLGLLYSVGIGLLGILGHFETRWRILEIILASPIVLILPMILIVKESPRWLLQNGHYAEVIDALQHGAKLHNSTIDAELVILRTRTAASVEKLGRAKALIATTSMLKITFLTPVIWYFQGMIYHGIILNASNFAKDSVFLYDILLGVVESSALLVAAPVTAWLGRRPVVGTALLVCGICNFVVLFIPQRFEVLRWCIVMFAFFAASSSFMVNHLYATELFPTEVRARGAAICSLTGSLGAMCAPILTDILSPLCWWSTDAVLSIGGVLASIIILLLPETLNVPLCDTVDDIELRAKGRKHRTFSICSVDPLTRNNSLASTIKLEDDLFEDTILETCYEDCISEESASESIVSKGSLSSHFFVRI